MHLLIRDVLDKQLIDRKGRRFGKVDGIVFELREGKPPRIFAVEIGAITLARRLHPMLEKWVRTVANKLGLSKAEAYLIPFKKIRSFGKDITVDLDAERSAAFAVERWVRKHIVARIP